MAAAQAGFDVIQAEKFSPAAIAELVERTGALRAPAGRRGGGRGQGGQCAGLRLGWRTHSRDLLALFGGALRCFRTHFRHIKAAFDPIFPSIFQLFKKSVFLFTLR